MFFAAFHMICCVLYFFNIECHLISVILLVAEIKVCTTLKYSD